MSKNNGSGNTTKKCVPNSILPEALAAVQGIRTDAPSCRNIRIHGRRTSIRLDDHMWDALNEIANLEKCTVHDICANVHDKKEDSFGFTAALRVFLLHYYRTITLKCATCRLHIHKKEG